MHTRGSEGRPERTESFTPSTPQLYTLYPQAVHPYPLALHPQVIDLHLHR